MRLIILLLSVILSEAAIAADWKKIDGIYALTAEGYLDPPEGAEKNSHLRIQLKNQAARDLYMAMNVDPVTDECTGGMAKNLKEMQCLYFRESGTYECHFSIRISEQKIEYGVAC